MVVVLVLASKRIAMKEVVRDMIINEVVTRVGIKMKFGVLLAKIGEVKEIGVNLKNSARRGKRSGAASKAKLNN